MRDPELDHSLAAAGVPRQVRDSYAVGNDKLLLVTSDRLSAFDVVMNQPIPDKGRVLNAMSNFWFEKLGHIVPNHLTGIAPEGVVAADERDQVRERAVVAMRLKPMPIEAVVRGYLIGSGWKDYQKTGEVCGIELPRGLQMAQNAGADLHAGHQGGQLGAARREHQLRCAPRRSIGAELAFKMQTSR